jgi:hypothetical protein
MTRSSSPWNSNIYRLFIELMGYELKNMNKKMQKILTRCRGAPGAICGG